MRDPYLYSDVEVLRNLGGIKTEIVLNEMEADYVSLRLSELAMDDYTGIFDIYLENIVSDALKNGLAMKSQSWEKSYIVYINRGK